MKKIRAGNKLHNKPDVCIYALVDPKTKIVRYIGSTNNIMARVRSHQNSCKPIKNLQFYNWLMGLYAKNLKPILWVVEVTGCMKRFEREKYYIEKYGKRKNLLNKQYNKYYYDNE